MAGCARHQRRGGGDLVDRQRRRRAGRLGRQVRDDATDAAALAESRVPTIREELDEPAVTPVLTQVGHVGMVLGVARDDGAEDVGGDADVRGGIAQLCLCDRGLGMPAIEVGEGDGDDVDEASGVVGVHPALGVGQRAQIRHRDSAAEPREEPVESSRQTSLGRLRDGLRRGGQYRCWGHDHGPVRRVGPCGLVRDELGHPGGGTVLRFAAASGTPREPVDTDGRTADREPVDDARHDASSGWSRMVKPPRSGSGSTEAVPFPPRHSSKCRWASPWRSVGSAPTMPIGCPARTRCFDEPRLLGDTSTIARWV